MYFQSRMPWDHAAGMIASVVKFEPVTMYFTPCRMASRMRTAVIAWSLGISESGVEARRKASWRSLNSSQSKTSV